jgi:hypothetical protein
LEQARPLPTLKKPEAPHHRRMKNYPHLLLLLKKKNEVKLTLLLLEGRAPRVFSIINSNSSRMNTMLRLPILMAKAASIHL